MITNSVIMENAPRHSVVGQLVGYDPRLELSCGMILDGNGSSGNSYFQLEGNGTLATAESFDFEREGGNLSIRARVSDERNASMELVFVISVIDEFRPIVRAKLHEGQAGIRISGRFGCWRTFRNHERGILVSSYAEPAFDHNHTTRHPADNNSSGGFEILVDGLESGKRYHYRAYAVNKEGISFGASQSFETPTEVVLPEWSGATPVQDAEGWWQSPWFGSFFMGDGNGWIRHEDLGWLYHIPDSEGVWLWQEKLGWTWTGSGIAPISFFIRKRAGSSSRIRWQEVFFMTSVRGMDHFIGLRKFHPAFSFHK